MKKPVVFMFSGQGSQYYHMGAELYRENSVFRHWMSSLDNVVYEKIGLSIIDEIYKRSKRKTDEFNQLLYTHLAIFMVEYSMAQVLIESGIEPDYVLGSSLGELTCVTIAGGLSFEEAIECILKQVKLIEDYCQPGAMIAIIHALELYDQSSLIYSYSDLAAINYSTHFIISGDYEKLLEVENYLKTTDILFQNLPVKYGFHSANIEPIESAYKKYLYNLSLKKIKMPIISCVLSECVKEISPEYFWNVIRCPICFQKTIFNLEKINQFNYIDMGSSGTLAKFVKNNLSENSLSQIYDILTPFGQTNRNLEKIKSIFTKNIIKSYT